MKNLLPLVLVTIVLAFIYSRTSLDDSPVPPGDSFAWEENENQTEKIEAPVGRSTQQLNLGGVHVKLDLYTPEGTSLPCVILVHGAAGLDGLREKRYLTFATSIMKSNMVAVVAHYFDSPHAHWPNAIHKSISFCSNLKNVNPEKIGVIGYSLGGTLAIQIAAIDKRVKALGINAGYLPKDFTANSLTHYPPAFMVSGDQDPAMGTLRALERLYTKSGGSFKSYIEQGAGHSTSDQNFWKQWNMIRMFMAQTLGAPGAQPRAKDPVQSYANSLEEF